MALNTRVLKDQPLHLPELPEKEDQFVFQGDDLYTKTLNKNEFVDRFYDNGDTVKQQTRRNRTTNIVTLRSGVDWFRDANNTFTVSGLFSSERSSTVAKNLSLVLILKTAIASGSSWKMN
ncbi:hypothetical protein [Paraflavitalea speifideaquila]|uniref:hypothetical protein n=1 Tax=Paraflavitalea speifideaquila TaxID=3076558 RepID=UPI0028EA6188|nr:hypothetical protein [Paraflavitalea speifideiaquila]